MLAFTTIILVTRCVTLIKELVFFWLLYKQMYQVLTLLCRNGCAIYDIGPCRPKFSCILSTCVVIIFVIFRGCSVVISFILCMLWLWIYMCDVCFYLRVLIIVSSYGFEE